MVAHNHSLNDNLVGHPGFRRQNDESKERIRIMHQSGTAPKDILSNIKVEFPTANCTIQEINNAIVSFRKEFLNGRTALEALLDFIFKKLK